MQLLVQMRRQLMSYKIITLDDCWLKDLVVNLVCRCLSVHLASWRDFKLLRDYSQHYSTLQSYVDNVLGELGLVFAKWLWVPKRIGYFRF